VIRENSVQGLAEMRQMIGLLREPAGEEPGAGPTEEATRARLSEVADLVERVRAAGLPVRSRVTGTPRAVPVAVDLAGYRIVQESLTNALKHGSGAAELEIGYESTAVVVSVTNPVRSGPEQGAAAAPGGLPEPVVGAGAGLIGMRERVALLDGRFTAGETAQGWRVWARLPTGEAT
jgi:signal transduction histidine kinase